MGKSELSMSSQYFFIQKEKQKCSRNKEKQLWQ